MAGRPRRTRLYDTSYNIGQSYYQPTLDRLDRKAYGKPDPITRALSPRPRFPTEDLLGMDDMTSARRRAERAITEDGFLDSRNIKMPTVNFDDEVDSSLSRFKSNKEQILADLDKSFDETVLAVRKNRDELTPLAGKTLKLKMVSSDQTEIANKWCRKTEMDSSLEASSRALATKARLHDLEADMFDRTERQAARDRRLASVRQVLRDSDADETAMKALSLAEKL